MTTLKAGDEVRVFRRGMYVRDPAEGWTGTVTKVGRKYGTAEYEYIPAAWSGTGRRTREATVEFDLATGYEKGDQYGNGVRVKTLEQVALDERTKAAEKVLRDAGFVTHAASTSPLELLEALAAVVEKFGTEGEQ